ncbi:MAG: flippase [Flavobacteriales bacterium]
MLKSEGARKYLVNTGWMFAEKVFRLALVLVTGVFVARFLGPTFFGQFNYATGFVGLFFALTAMGLDEIVVRDLVRHPERRDELLGSAALLKFCGASLLVILASVIGFLKNMETITLLVVVIVAVSELLKPFVVIEYWFQAQVRARAVSKVLIIQSVVSAAWKLGLVWLLPRDAAGLPTESALLWFAWAYVIELIASAIGSVVAYGNAGGVIRAWRVTRQTAGHLLRESWPLLIYGVALYVQAKIDQVMIFDVLKDRIGQEAAYAEAGQYANALKMIEALGFLPVIVQKSLAPAITRARMESMAKYEDRLLNQYRLMFLMFLVTAVPLFFLAQPIMVLLYGEPFRPSGALLSLFSIRLLFTNMGMGKTSFITNESLFKYSLATALVGAGLNIAINYVLIPHFQSAGAIWATIISFTVSIFMLDLCFKSTRANFGWMMKAMFSFWKVHRAA